MARTPSSRRKSLTTLRACVYVSTQEHRASTGEGFSEALLIATQEHGFHSTAVGKRSMTAFCTHTCTGLATNKRSHLNHIHDDRTVAVRSTVVVLLSWLRSCDPRTLRSAHTCNPQISLHRVQPFIRQKLGG
jgi:hypothetical protein